MTTVETTRKCIFGCQKLPKVPCCWQCCRCCWFGLASLGK